MTPELRARKVGGYNGDVMLKLAPHTYATPCLLASSVDFSLFDSSAASHSVKDVTAQLLQAWRCTSRSVHVSSYGSMGRWVDDVVKAKFDRFEG